jgi:UDP-N-acetylmuramate dehydrogenase
MIKQPFDLKNFNTFGFATQSQAGALISSLEELHTAINFAKSNQLPLLTIGGGSNIVLKEHLPHLVLIIRIPGVELLKDEQDHVLIRVGAGVEWDDLVQYSLNQKWYGLENLSIIPGTVGACPIQNVGAYGVEIKDFFHELTALEIDTLQEKVLSKDDCRFSYRDSIFKNAYRDRFIITSVTFKLSKKPKINLIDRNLRKELSHLPEYEITPEHVREAVITIRTRRLPDVKSIGNAGSFFMNPIIDETLFYDVYTRYPDVLFTELDDKQYKISAGWLIERCGWKGFQDKAVGVFDINPLVLVNRGGGTASELLALSDKIIQSVYETFGISLKMEPRLYT